MKNKGKKVKAIDYFWAKAIADSSSWITIDDFESLPSALEAGDFEPGFSYGGRIVNPEKLVIKKQQYDNLSVEAKEVINLLLDCPAEVITVIGSPVKGVINKRRLSKFLRKTWNSRKKVRDVLLELSDLVKSF